MQKIPLTRGCQRFVSVFSAVRNLFISPTNGNAVSRHVHRVRTMDKRHRSYCLKSPEPTSACFIAVNVTCLKRGPPLFLAVVQLASIIIQLN